MPHLACRVVHACERYVVVEKPAGMLSVPGKGSDRAHCVASWVREKFPHAAGPLIAHRLDMDTSGLMVLGLTESAQRSLSEQFERRIVEKAYTALVAGIVGRDSGEISLPLRLDVTRRPYQIVDFLLGRPATTRFTVLSREIDRTRVRFEPVTGRTHQLRVHAASPSMVTDHLGAERQGGLGAPILGDVLYSREDAPPQPRLMLHASMLAFREPTDRREPGRFVRFESAAPF